MFNYTFYFSCFICVICNHKNVIPFLDTIMFEPITSLSRPREIFLQNFPTLVMASEPWAHD